VSENEDDYEGMPALEEVSEGNDTEFAVASY